MARARELGRRPLRIAMVMAAPFPANHGTPGSVREMAEAITAAGHEIHFVAYPYGEGEKPEGLHLHRPPDIGLSKRVVVGPTWQKPILDFLMIFTLWRTILREKIDVIHAHNYEAALVGFLGKLVTGRPLVYNAINTMSDELPSYNFIRPRKLAEWLARFLDWLVPRLADRTIAISDELVAFLQDQRIEAEAIRMIPLGVDLTPFDQSVDPSIRDRYDLNGGGPIVMYTGVLDTFQRIDYLLRAMSRVRERVPSSRLILAANLAKDEDVEACQELCRELGLSDCVTVHLNTPFSDIPGLLSAAEVAVAPRPDCPGFPVKLLNYAAARKAIVVPEGSAKGLENGKNALVVEDHDWRAMGDAIADLLSDRELARTIGGNARTWVNQHFSWPSLALRVESLYFEVLGREAVAT